MKTNPFVCIVIINWNCYQDTFECVQALRKSTYKNFEIVIVDNASTDDSLEKIKQTISDIVLIKSEKNLGWAGGNNLGARDAFKRVADYILCLNADAFVEPDTIEKMVCKAEMLPEIGLVTSVLYYFQSRRLQHCGSGIDWDKCEKEYPEDISKMERIPPDRFWIWFTAALIKRKVFDVIGFFEEKYFCYCEDLEYSMRAYRAGFKIAVAKDANVFHRCHEMDMTGQENLKPYFFFYMTRNNFLFFKEYSPRKLRFYRKFLSKTFMEIGNAKTKSKQAVVDAHLDGLYCGFKGITGIWDETKKMPVWIKRIIISHPYFWAHMLNGDFIKTLKSQ